MAAYYNEIEPYAVEWLRNLIRKGLIADGIVDDRSIASVEASDLGDFSQCHFFAGIGVWSHALRLAGWPDDRPVWTGSCPCQPFSAAGKQKGFADERHLWPEFHRLIRECRPPVVFGEQVASKDGLAWLDIVSTDLETSGYAIGAADLCAASCGAPHIRQRLWFVGERLADASSCGGGAGLRDSGSAGKRGDQLADSFGTGGLGHDNNEGLEGQRDGHQAEGGWNGAAGPVAEAGEPRGVADAEHDDGQADEPRRRPEGRAADGWDGATGRVADADGGHPSAEREQRSGEQRQQQQQEDGGTLHGGRPGPTNGAWRAADWLHCRDGKWRPVEPGTFPLAHGAPSRVGRLRAYGNAIVPQVAAEVISAFMGARP